MKALLWLYLILYAFGLLPAPSWGTCSLSFPSIPATKRLIVAPS
jgi:hypothetical protein